ncbi:MAG: phosphatidylethanolamine/phosphatidyl-N-methylethanolamine N-methyltransferase [Flavobacteriales bacterium]|jgi:phosphatidylethanolamine/phosphatidyl-N-methylethanolamine N-methyltransferase
MKINTNRWNIIRYTVYLPIYDALASVFSGYRKQSIDLLKLTHKQRILIIGAGTGADLEYLEGQADITAVDLTPGMISRLKIRASKLHLAVDARVMDAHKLEFDDASFDVVILHLILAVIPDPYLCIREVERVLRPGGQMVIMDKFIQPNTRPSLMRRLVNPITDLFFSNITRDVEEILGTTELEIIGNQQLKSIFRLVYVMKRAD